jgi:hypothetical protein
MDSTEYTIRPWDTASFGAELGICQEWRNGPSRHNADYVISHPVWNQPHAMCKEHLERIADEDSDLRAAWERTKKHGMLAIYVFKANP